MKVPHEPSELSSLNYRKTYVKLQVLEIVIIIILLQLPYTL